MNVAPTYKEILRLRAILCLYQAAALDAEIALYRNAGNNGSPELRDQDAQLCAACRMISLGISCAIAFPSLGTCVEQMRKDANGKNGTRRAWLLFVVERVADLVKDPKISLRYYKLPTWSIASETDPVEVYHPPTSCHPGSCRGCTLASPRWGTEPVRGEMVTVDLDVSAP